MTDARRSMEDLIEDRINGLQGFVFGVTAAVEGAKTTYMNGLRAFFAGLEPAVVVARRAQAELDRVTAPAFSPFVYFNTGELGLSRVFGDLLDPGGTHGQGDVFLRVLLDGLPELADVRRRSDLSACHVHLEFITRTLDADRRIDIVLEIPGGPWIGIENKPWAADQENQVGDYLHDLRGRGSGPVWLLYLSGDGTDPAEYMKLGSDDRRRCVTVAYRGPPGQGSSIEAWIKRCIDECRAERVRWFLGELLRFIQRTFSSSATESLRSTL